MNEYLIDLGNGMFLDAAGEIVQPPPGWTGQQQPVFTAPGGYFPIDPSAWVDATVRPGFSRPKIEGIVRARRASLLRSRR